MFPLLLIVLERTYNRGYRNPSAPEATNPKNVHTFSSIGDSSIPKKCQVCSLRYKDPDYGLFV